MKWIQLIILCLFLNSCAKDMLEFNPYTTIAKQLYKSSIKKNDTTE